MMNFIVWLIAGAVLGLLTVQIIHDRELGALIIFGCAGAVGAVLAGYLVTPMFHISTFNQQTFSLQAFFVSLAGACILLAVVYALRKKRTITDKVFAARWTLVRSKMHVRWNRLTEEDINQIDGNHDKLIGLLQERYGLGEEKAEDDLQDYLRAVVEKSKHSWRVFG